MLCSYVFARVASSRSFFELSNTCSSFSTALHLFTLWLAVLASFDPSHPSISVLSSQNSMLRFVFLLFALVASAYGFRFPFVRSMSHKSLQMMSETVVKETFIEKETVEQIRKEPTYGSLAISGFISKKDNFAEPYVFSQLFSTGKYSAITTITDDIKFARKRFVNPTTVYSGMIDVLDFQECDQTESSLETVLANKEAWIAYDVSSAQLQMYANVAAKLKLKRAIFAVKTDPSERGPDVTFNATCDILKNAGVEYTILKYGDMRPMAEAKYPYRVMRGGLSIPTEGQGLSTGDLWRIIAEVLDLPKSFNNVYSVGSGTRLDAEILVYMKSMGWPERVQVGLLVGDLMEKIERRWKAEKAIKAYEAAQVADKKKLKETTSNSLPKEGEGNKFAGFFA